MTEAAVCSKEWRIKHADPGCAVSADMRGHNSERMRLKVEVRLFNSLSRYAKAGKICRHVDVAAGSTVGDLIRMLKLPVSEIFLVLRNGRDITPGLYCRGAVNEDAVLDDADVVAFSGPVPYSYGYVAPVV